MLALCTVTQQLMNNSKYYIIYPKPVYSALCGHCTLGSPKVAAIWRGYLPAQVKIHAKASIWTLPPGCYREVTCLYSDRYTQVPLYPPTHYTGTWQLIQ